MNRKFVFSGIDFLRFLLLSFVRVKWGENFDPT